VKMRKIVELMLLFCDIVMFGGQERVPDKAPPSESGGRGNACLVERA
jgi:hypothetical protein